MKKITLKQCKEDKLLILIDNEAQLKHIAKFVPGIHFNKNKYYPGLLRIFEWARTFNSFDTKSYPISYIFLYGMTPEKVIANTYGGKFKYIPYSQLQLLTKEDKDNLLQLIKSI